MRFLFTVFAVLYGFFVVEILILSITWECDKFQQTDYLKLCIRLVLRNLYDYNSTSLSYRITLQKKLTQPICNLASI